MNEDKEKIIKGTKHKVKEEKKKEKKVKETKRSEPKKKEKNTAAKPAQTPKEKKSSPKKSKAEKGKEEKQQPKRAWPAFFFFQKDKRAEVKKDHPELAQKELVAVSGVAAWWLRGQILPNIRAGCSQRRLTCSETGRALEEHGRCR